MDSTIWEGMQQQQLEGGLLLTSCGAELQELMRQIDIMVRQKKMDWERQFSSVQDKLEVREQELHHSKSLLNQKHQEIAMLKHKLDGNEGNQRSVIRQYENQLSHMRDELKQLKMTYTKMQKYYTKQGKVSEREQSLQKEIDRLQNELTHKVNRDTEVQKEKSNWEVQQLALKQQIECLEVQRKSLAEKAERFQQQAYAYQARLKRSNQMVEEVESTSQSLVKKLESELLNDKELIQTQEGLIKELQTKTQELEDMRKKAVREKYHIQEELDKMICRARVFEDEGRELTATLNARESAIRDSELESAELKNRIADLENMLRTKQKLIESLQTRSPLKSREDEIQRNVAHLESVITTYRTTEANLREENRKLMKEAENSRQEIKDLSDAVKNMELAKVNNLHMEIRRLRDKVEDMQTSHSATLCGMKADVTNFTSHLHNRDANIAQLSQTCGEMERQLKDECQKRDQLATELQVTTTQLEHLRNQQSVMSRLVREKKVMDQSLIEAEHDLSSLQQNYEKAVGKLEEENRTLLKKVSNLKDKMHAQESVHRPDFVSALEHTRNVINDLRGKDSLRMQEVCDQYEKQIADLNTRLQDMFAANEVKISEQVNVPPIAIYPTPSGSQGSSTKRYTARFVSHTGCRVVLKNSTVRSSRTRTPTPTRDFLKSIGIGPSTVTTTSAHSSVTSDLDGSIDDQELNAILGLHNSNGNSADKLGVDGDGVQEFMKEEEIRSKQLESRINQHIENMTQAMAAAVDKYLVPV